MSVCKFAHQPRDLFGIRMHKRLSTLGVQTIENDMYHRSGQVFNGCTNDAPDRNEPAVWSDRSQAGRQASPADPDRSVEVEPPRVPHTCPKNGFTRLRSEVVHLTDLIFTPMPVVSHQFVASSDVLITVRRSCQCQSNFADRTSQRMSDHSFIERIDMQGNPRIPNDDDRLRESVVVSRAPEPLDVHTVSKAFHSGHC